MRSSKFCNAITTHTQQAARRKLRFQSTWSKSISSSQQMNKQKMRCCARIQPSQIGRNCISQFVFILCWRSGHIHWQFIKHIMHAYTRNVVTLSVVEGEERQINRIHIHVKAYFLLPRIIHEKWNLVAVRKWKKWKVYFPSILLFVCTSALRCAVFRNPHNNQMNVKVYFHFPWFWLIFFCVCDISRIFSLCMISLWDRCMTFH